VRDIILLLIGAVIGFLVNLLSAALFPKIRLWYKQLALRYFSKSRKQLMSPTFMLEKLTVGGLPINLIILARVHYKPGHIRCSYDRTPVPLKHEFAQMKRKFISDWKKRLANGENKLPYNSATYKLKEFNIGFREIVDGEEVPVLRLLFGPTDYFTQIVTDYNINNPIRENYARTVSLAEHPVPQFASCFGVDLNLITKDGYLILAERSQQTYIDAGKIQTSVGEGLLRPTDGGRDGAPDPFRCAIRGAQEEIGILLDYQDIEFTTFSVSPTYYQYYLIGTIHIPHTRADIEELRQLATPKDKWAIRRLLFVPCNPDSLAQFSFPIWDQWEQAGLAKAVISLLDSGYSKKAIDAAFIRAQSKTSRK
jgi:hypothetical protein